MDCHEAVEYLYDLLDRELTPDLEQRIRQHLEECSDCFSRYRFEQGFHRFLRARRASRGAPHHVRRLLFEQLMLGEADLPLESAVAEDASSRGFRSLLGSFATGVTVATAVDPTGHPVGMTASAVSAVSLDPPLLLVCVQKDARFHAVLETSRAFALNVLSRDQAKLSDEFARPATSTFENVPYDSDGDGVPLLREVVAHILCRKWSSYEAGDHTVFFGRVTGGEVFDRSPLVHYRSRYTTIEGE